jgi:hypothetical protein
MIAATPPAPYYAVIFTSERTAVDDGYAEMSDRMVDLPNNNPAISAMNRQGMVWGLPFLTGKAWKRSATGKKILNIYLHREKEGKTGMHITKPGFAKWKGIMGLRNEVCINGIF